MENIETQTTPQLIATAKTNVFFTITSELWKLLLWFLTFFEEDNGKASTKRIIAWVLAIALYKSIVKAVETPIEQWGNANYFLITIFGMIGSLLCLAYIPTRKDDIDK